MAQKLAGKVAVVTGGNAGIGLATARRFAAEGAHVFITGRRQGELDAAVKQIDGSVTAVQGDVAKLADLDRLYAEVKRQKGRIDILFANAGVLENVPLGSITEEHFDKLFNIVVHGAESSAFDSRRRFNHLDLFRRQPKRFWGFERLQRHQGGGAVLCTLLDR
jgi:NAD(P)-dependent dehydrogenase (short-subunit alcohol dehydrogenase family)